MRVLGRALSFAVFGVGGLLLAFGAFPLVRLLPGSEGARQLRCQKLIHHAFRGFVRFMGWMGVLRLEIAGAAGLREPGQVVVANHPTLIDVVVLVAHMPQADCVVKKQAWANPFLRGAVGGAGYVPNDMGQELLEACAERLREGRSLLLFPEGTRSPAGGLGPFRRGAAHVALASGAPLRPVTIHCRPASLMRGQPWHDVGDRPMDFRIEVGAPMDPKDHAEPGDPRGSAARQLSAALREYFESRLALHRAGAEGPGLRA